MAKKWYPVIDYMTCTECGICVENCPNGVYDKAKTPTPVVTNPAACVKGCRYCADNCPVEAISYVGDNGSAKAADSCCGGGCCEDTKEATACCGDGCCGDGCCGDDDEVCSCGDDDEECSCGDNDTEPCCGDVPEKIALVEYLYLDLHTCDRCMGTDTVLDDVMKVLTPALRLSGYDVQYKKIHMDTQEVAKRYRFLSSPTIRVNGRDICKSVAESPCGCCGEISGTDVDCRVFEFGGKTYEVPPKQMLAESILKTLFSGDGDDGCSCGEYEMPDNLKEFFAGKGQKTSGWCKESCC